MSASRSVARVVTMVMVVGTLFGSPLQAAHASRGKGVVAPAVKRTGNLIKNPGAEAGVSVKGGPVTLPNWHPNNSPAGVLYGAPGGFPDANTPGPPKRGKYFFAGGPLSATGGSTLTQNISFAKYASAIDAGRVSFTLKGWLGGYASDRDYAYVTVSFSDASGEPIASSRQIGPVTNTDRGDQTKFLVRTLQDGVPGLTRSVHIAITFVGLDGAYMDGYADNLSLVLSGI
jgi:hypothetical protein